MESTRYDLIVVGGGPAGSTAAAIAARAGLRVLLLEAATHPRTHVGESLLPGIIPILEEMGALADVDGAGFIRKSGSTHWGWGLTPSWDLWFADSETYDYSWLVDRSKFDEILFKAAIKAGAEVHTFAAVKQFVREGERVVGVLWKGKGEEGLRRADASITIDATGHAALMARVLKLRSTIPGLQHECSWAHYENSGSLPPPREQQALFFGTSGMWIWHFPLGDGKASIGIIRLEGDGRSSDEDRERLYDEAVKNEPRLMGVIGPEARRSTPVRTLHDWSYKMSQVTGPGWLLAGDSSGFIDPVLATGVFLAMHAAFHAAKLVVAITRGERAEAEGFAEYQSQHDALFSDLLRIVRFFYQQNLYKEDYFWGAKKILVTDDNEIKPQKAFMILTSGLVRNLAFMDKKAEVRARRETAALSEEARPELDAHDPDKLGFVCFHLRYRHGDEKVALYFLIEPRDPAAPTLFRSTNWHVNCLAPRFQNDPIRIPELAPYLRNLGQTIRDLDTLPGDQLVDFWRRTRGSLLGAVKALPEAEFELVRVFGE